MLPGKLVVQDKLALVTGASQGLGLELAEKLYNKGCSVILVARREAVIKKEAERIKSNHGKFSNTIDYIACDVSDYKQCQEMWASMAQDGKDPDFIFNCVGGSVCKLFTELSGDELSLGINTNYTATLFPIHAGIKQVLGDNQSKSRKEFKHRHIVIFLSVAGVYPLIGYSQYAPLKAALMALSLNLRQELTAYNYRVSCIFPGNFDSEGYREEERTKPSITKKIEGSSVAITTSKAADMILRDLDRGYDVSYTDSIGWILSSASLGTNPRYWSVLQIIVSFLFSIIAPFASMAVDRDIEGYFKEKDKED